MYRLATVQSSRLPTAPLVSTKHDVSDDDRCALMSSIRQLVPDHAARFRAVQVNAVDYCRLFSICRFYVIELKPYSCE